MTAADLVIGRAQRLPFLAIIITILFGFTFPLWSQIMVRRADREYLGLFAEPTVNEREGERREGRCGVDAEAGGGGKYYLMVW